MLEIILKKERGKSLSYEELALIFNSYLEDKVSDELMTRLLKAICVKGLTYQETKDLTEIFIKSGEVIDWGSLRVIDKHSTGGIGDKVTLILTPVLASLNIKVAKMSGRALGYTGGTIDKLEAIPNFKTSLSIEEFKKEIEDIGMAITSQTGNLCPLDKKVYALRDVTGTVSSLGLIASSIMSKKIASGAKAIYLDIKVGKGALVKNLKEARCLAKMMIAIGRSYERKVVCFLTNMDIPLGNRVGNQLEVMEALDILKGKESGRLYDLVVLIASKIVMDEQGVTFSKAKELVTTAFNSGKAYNKFLEFVRYQGGDLTKMENNFKVTDVLALKNGYLTNIDSLIIGEASMALGAGRVKKNDKIDYQAGVILKKKIGDYVKKGEVICSLVGSKKIDLNFLSKAFTYSKFKRKRKDLILDVIE